MENKQLRLSPSAINTYFRCPRLFYYNYLLKKRAPPNIHLYKGTFVHRILENIFMSTKYIDIQEYADKQMEKWKPSKSFFSEKDDPEFHKNEAKKMLEIFAKRFDDKIDMLLMEGKAKGRNHAWNLCKPVMREHRIYDKDLHMVGIIDSIETNYNEQVYLIDYKTSKLYRHTVSDDYVRQVSIYAYLYKKEFGKMPDFVGIHYLRYGEIYFVPVTDEMIQNIYKEVIELRKKITSTNKEDYPRCSFKWCDCNYFEKDEVDVDDEVREVQQEK